VFPVIPVRGILQLEAETGRFRGLPTRQQVEGGPARSACGIDSWVFEVARAQAILRAGKFDVRLDAPAFGDPPGEPQAAVERWNPVSGRSAAVRRSFLSARDIDDRVQVEIGCGEVAQAAFESVQPGFVEVVAAHDQPAGGRHSAGQPRTDLVTVVGIPGERLGLPAAV